MTPREIILANLTHAGPPRPGFTFSGGRLNDMAGPTLGPSTTYAQKRWTEGDKEYYDDAWGNVWVRMIDGSTSGEIHEPVLKDWSQLENLQLPDYDDDSRFEAMRQQLAQPSDKFRRVFLPGWVFATSRYLRKMEVYFCDLIEYRAEIDRLHEIVTDLLVRVIDKVGKAGADAIMYCEDLGTQDRPLIGPAMWRDVFRPHYLRLTGCAHDHGMKVLMHSCGYNWDLIDDLVDAGVDCFQFDQPAAYDMPALADKLKARKVALWSPVDIQQVLPTGDRERIEAEARKMVDLFGGFLIVKDYGDLPTIGVEPEWDMWAYNALRVAAGLAPE